jgi:hypothetical protein
MTTVGTLTWQSKGSSTEYRFDGKPVGNDETGFRNILQYLSSGNVKRVVVEYPAATSNDGREPYESFPFRNLYDEFIAVTENKNITVEYAPKF